MRQQKKVTTMESVSTMRRVCAEIGANLQDLSQDRESLVESGAALVNLSTMLHRTLRRMTDEAGRARGLDLERALVAYRQLHAALLWFREHQYGALTFELRHHLSNAQRCAALALDALQDWEHAKRKGAARAATLQRARA